MMKKAPAEATVRNIRPKTEENTPPKRRYASFSKTSARPARGPPCRPELEDRRAEHVKFIDNLASIPFVHTHRLDVRGNTSEWINVEPISSQPLICDSLRD